MSSRSRLLFFLPAFQENVRRNHLEDKVSVRIGELLEPLTPDERGRVRGVLSNPPYIPSSDLANLQLEVRSFDRRDGSIFKKVL